ncbi:MAG: hypothetical protein HOC70_06995 [Gammaproteobacteria bacterium]|jgi:hypothetical protein|nr:hypothetical protein [Gammaproteobacteria bacterium]MBT4492974.1 hypothetical protein [Gammaproteobacteria bacterium]MBT7371369.1 hypothetical protein [Gammaproteobacteria bacterium]
MNFPIFRLLVFVSIIVAAGSTVADPLFEKRDLLTISIAADFKTMFDEKDKSKQYPGRLVQGDSNPIDILLEVRGNSRLRNCKVPGLRIIFPKKPKDGLFAKQKKLKLVNQCWRKGGRYQDYLLQEYAIYRAYEVLTDNSFRTRLAGTTYIDTGPNDYSWMAYAFFIEDKSRMAKRLGLKRVRDNRISQQNLAKAESNLAVMYQFLIGNADFSHITGEADEPCCHNAKLLNKDGKYIPVPYDFDLAGIINTIYAIPPPNLGIKKVIQRLYRGHCDNNDVVPSTLAHIQANRDQLYETFLNERIRERTRKNMSKYLDKFFRLVADEKHLQKKIYGKCR